MEKELSILIILLISLSVFCFPMLGIGLSGSPYIENSGSEGGLLGNVTIESDEGLEDFVEDKELPGDGTEENPYVLYNYTIDGTGDNYSVYLENTELHFVIKNSKIYNSSEACMKINNVSNFTFENSVVKNSTYGVEIESSDNVTIKSSSIYDLNSTGLNIESSERLDIRGAKIYNITENGLNIESSEDIIIENSSISENERGIYLQNGANNNTITNNNISNNNWGIRILESNNNLIHHNIFFENNIQAHDEGDNEWDDREVGGNYWSDYENRYEDANESENIGIWDTPYEIEVNNSDNNPLISPVGPPINVKAQPVRAEYVNITWDSPLYSIRYPVEEIHLYRGEEEDNLTFYERLNLTSQVFRDENVSEDKTYFYGLVASNEKYDSVMSEVQRAQPDTTSPEVQHYYLVDDRLFEKDDEVPINATILLTFSEEMKKDSVSISIEDEDGEDIKGDLYGEETEFYFEPYENLSYETTYHISVNGSDKASNWLESPYTWSFTTISDTGMVGGRIINEEGEPLENVRIYFDEENQAFTDSSGKFQIEVPSGNVTLEISKDGYQDKEIEIQVNQSEEKEIGDIILREQEDIVTRWFWPMALAGGGILLLGLIAFIISFYNWEEEEIPPDEDIYDIDYEDVDQEEFESWWDDENS